MEPAGLAVGLVGLAGLFSSCLEVVDRFDSWKNFGSDSQSLGSRFRAEKLRLEKWGETVGFERGTLSRDHHEALDDARIISKVREHLLIIEDICSNTNDASLLVAGTDAEPAKHGLLPGGQFQLYPSTLSKSRTQRVKWALRDKAKCIAQVENLGRLVQDLHNLVPPDGTKGTRTARGRAGNVALGHTDGTNVPRWSLLRNLTEVSRCSHRRGTLD